MDLTLARFRQITAAIQRRLYFEFRKQISLTSWQTRIQAQYTAAGYMTDDKSENKALTAARSLAYDEIERKMLEAADKAQASRPASKGSESKPGDYERFLSTFGNPRRWSGGR